MNKHIIRKLIPFAFADGVFAPTLHAAAASEKKMAALLETYCQDCHNSVDWSGGLALDVMGLGDIPGEAKTWEKVVRKLRGRMMPPPTNAQPSQANVDQLVAFVEGRIDAIDQATAAKSLRGQGLVKISLHDREVGLIEQAASPAG